MHWSIDYGLDMELVVAGHGVDMCIGKDKVREKCKEKDFWKNQENNILIDGEKKYWV